VPVIYIVLATLIVIDLAYLAPATSGVGYLLVLTGIPVYMLWRKANRVRKTAGVA
jgi:APA family basic amino acid/polyamine antiporter